MKSKERRKMPIEERAKQFAPFSPLRGLHEALSRVERVVVPKVELSEEMEEALNRALHSIEKGDMVTVIYYSDEEYVQMTGKVARVNPEERFLQVVDRKIEFEDLYSLKK